MPALIALLARLGLSQRVASLLGHLVPLALVGALCGFLWARGDHFMHQRDHANDQLALANAHLAVSNASIATLQQSLAQFVGAGKAAQAASTASLAAQQPKNAELQAQAAAIREDMAKAADGGCETPVSVKNAKGL